MKILLIKKIFKKVNTENRSDEWFETFFNALYELDKKILYKLWKLGK